METRGHQKQVYSVDPNRLPRHRYFQKRLHDILPRMKRIIEHEYGQSCQKRIDDISSRIKNMSKTPTIRLLNYGDGSNLPARENLLRKLSSGTGASDSAHSDDLDCVLVMWTSGVEGKETFDLISKQLKECYARRDNDVEQVTPVIICIEKDDSKKGIVSYITHKTNQPWTGFDSARQLVIVNAKGCSFDQDAKELKRGTGIHLKDTTTVCTDQDSEQGTTTRYKSQSPTRRTRNSPGTAKQSPPKVLERVQSQTDSTDDHMEIDPVKDSRVEHSSLSPRPTTRSMTIKTKHSPSTTFERVQSPMQTDSTDDHMEVDPVQGSGVAQSFLSHRPTTRSMTTQKGSDQEAKECLGHSPTSVQPATEHSLYDVNDETVLLDAISYQLETIHIHTLKMIEKLVNEVNNKPKHETEVMSTMDKLLFEVAGVFYQSITTEGTRRREEAEKKKLSKQLTGDLLSVQHVYGCGRLYGKLHVHIDKTDDQASVRQRIEHVLKEHKYKYAFEMKPILEKPTRFDRSHRASVLICSA